MTTDFDWAELAFASKKPLTSLKATFIAAPRELSAARFTELVKSYLPLGPIVLGIAKEAYVDGFEDQPQFRTLRREAMQGIIDKVNASSPRKIYTLSYFQRELDFIIEKVGFARAVFVNGSWLHSFHTRPTYYALMSRGVPYELVSPFAGEEEALAYADRIEKSGKLALPSGTVSDIDALRLADDAAKASFDHTFQTGALIAKPTAKGYRALLSGFNKVVPYQSYALHHGSSRERHFSPPNDLNYYDTIHAEMSLLVQAQRQGLSLKGLSLFVNLMPCPSCARTLAETDLAEIVYRFDHSEGYAADLLMKAGKTVRRIVY